MSEEKLTKADPLAGIPRCGTCPHYHQFNQEPRGDCYRFPPVADRGSKWRPLMREEERCCGEHPQFQAALAAPTVAVKAQPLTPPQAAKPDFKKGGRR